MKPEKEKVDELYEFLRSLHGPERLEVLEAEAKRFADYLNSLRSFGLRDAKQPSEHVGRVTVDAVLQVGLRYETHVRSRVEHIRDNYPQAATVSGFLRLLENLGAQKLICWKGKDQEERLLRSARFFASRRIETFPQLYEWLRAEENRDSLITSKIGKIKDKTADYYRKLVGHWDAVAVDKGIRHQLDEAGVVSKNYKYKEQRTIVQLTALLLNTRPIDLDSSIYYYNYVRNKLPRGGTKYCIECCAKIPRMARYCPKCGAQQCA